MAKKTGPFLSIYIESKGIHFIAVSEKGGQKVLHRQRLDFPKGSGGPLQGAAATAQIIERLKSPELKKAAAETLQKFPVKYREAGVCFSDTFSISRFFTMPVVEDVYKRKAIPIEARKHVPLPLDECLYDSRTVPLKVGDKPLMGVFFSAVRRDIFEAALSFCNSLGFKVDFSDALPSALSRAVERMGAARNPPLDISKETILAVYLDTEQVQISILSRAAPVLSRSIYLSESTVKGSFLMERRKLDLMTTLDFVKSQFGIEKMDRLLLFAPPVIDKDNLANWASGLSEELGLKVDASQTFLPGFTTPEGNPVILTSWGEVVGLGTALRDVSPATAPFNLDLSVLYFAAPARETAMRKIWTGAVAVSILFLVLAGWRALSVQSLKSKLVSIRRQGSQGIADLQGKNSSDIKLLLSKRSAELAALSALTNSQNRLYLTPIFSELAGAIPKESWIESWAYRSDLFSDAASASAVFRAVVAWRGRVYALDGQKDFATVNAFFKNIKENPVMIRHFPESDISVRREEASASGRSGRPTVAYVMEFNTHGTKQQ